MGVDMKDSGEESEGACEAFSLPPPPLSFFIPKDGH
jgi:hypothetical protein